MKRLIETELQHWFKSNDRKPLIIRGARQVGKTWLIRHFAHSLNYQLVELNFEQYSQYRDLFKTNDPREILLNIETALGISINIQNSILFLDEIQAVPELLAKLRWFYENLPELPVIAAGSLLEFVLAEHSFSMPVGRIEYLYLEPFSFLEFLQALTKEKLKEYIENFQWSKEIPGTLHEQLMKIFKQYILIGGMPAAIKKWLETQSLADVQKIQMNLIATYQDDFNRYSKKIPVEIVQAVFKAVPRMIAKKFIYSKVDENLNSEKIKQTLNLLSLAKICHKVIHTNANGVPIGAEINEKFIKVIFLDVGLCASLLGLNLMSLDSVMNFRAVNNGAISEQIVGQMLRTIYPSYIEPKNFYWQRQTKGSEAEVDYVIQINDKVYPIEVKAGTTGTLKSLHVFMENKKLNLAFRINADVPSRTAVNIKTSQGNTVEYELFSLPFYLVSEISRLAIQS